MRDWIAVIIAVLGVLLVLAGATLILLRALPARPAPAPAAGPSPSVLSSDGSDTSDLSPAVPVGARISSAWKEPTAADRLIFWGVILLVLAAIAAGAITFNLGAAGGATPATR
ncbi:hypothetical protein GCM10009827_020250 [Dactylosporangium maewongense]|uniref:Uncharacterized protein n=1 Tax=Dactylosporangium maewongense TaxID=634393 RepID=A0ABN1ZWX6_9ACTN